MASSNSPAKKKENGLADRLATDPRMASLLDNGLLPPAYLLVEWAKIQAVISGPVRKNKLEFHPFNLGSVRLLWNDSLEPFQLGMISLFVWLEMLPWNHSNLE